MHMISYIILRATVSIRTRLFFASSCERDEKKAHAVAGVCNSKLGTVASTDKTFTRES